MDRIDHYPQFQNQEDQHAGRVAGEIRALREQQENIYFRDIERQTESNTNKKKKKEETEELVKEIRKITHLDLNSNLIGSVRSVDQLKHETSESIVTIVVILLFTFLVAFATYSLTH